MQVRVGSQHATTESVSSKDTGKGTAAAAIMTIAGIGIGTETFAVKSEL
jgi:hypothetical protein